MTRQEKMQQAMDDAKKRFAPLIGIFNSQMGHDAMKLLEEEFIFQTTHVKGDPHESAYLEGQRALVLWLRDVVNKHGE